MLKIQPVTHQKRTLTYEEWIESLKREQNVIVSGLYRAKSIEQRVMIDESIQYKNEILRVVQDDRESGILFGVKNLLSKFNGMVRLPILFGKKIN
jgi:hypothetical protein